MFLEPEAAALVKGMKQKGKGFRGGGLLWEAPRTDG
jgi:hypothetical protein